MSVYFIRGGRVLDSCAGEKFERPWTREKAREDLLACGVAASPGQRAHRPLQAPQRPCGGECPVRPIR